MPRRKIPVRPTTEKLINSFGFSTTSLEAMQSMTPHIRPLSEVVRGWAKFLLKAESKTELRWIPMGIPLIEDYYQSKVALWKPKAMSFNLPGGSYTPDFFYIFEDGRRLHIEVKGSKMQVGYRDARSKMRAAATLYWFDSFMLVMPMKGAKWELEEILPDRHFQTELQILTRDIDFMNDGGMAVLKELSDDE